MERKVNYTKEFKIQACELVVKNGLKVKAVADKMGISHIMLYRWIDQYKTFGKDAFVGKGNLRPEEAKQEILSYIYLYYNSERLHSGIGYRTPNSVWM